MQVLDLPAKLLITLFLFGIILTKQLTGVARRPVHCATSGPIALLDTVIYFSLSIQLQFIHYLLCCPEAATARIASKASV